MKLFRTLSTPRLLALLGAAAAALVVGVAIAVAARGTGPTPPPLPLAQALHDAAAAAPPAGVTARVTFTNGLLPSAALGGQAGSALLAGASGRLWVTNDGRGRLELQSNASGDTQITWTGDRVSVYDASSNTDYRLTLPQHGDATPATETPPTLADVTSALADLGAHWTLSGAQPTDVAARGAYQVRVSPKGSGGLLDSAEVAWDALNGVPLRVAVYAKGVTGPVLELAATDVSFGPVAAPSVDVAPPAGAKVVDVPTSATGTSAAHPDVTGLAAVQARVAFPVAAPAALGGLARTEVRLVGDGSSAGALVVYGQGLGAVAVLEQPAEASASSATSGLPTVKVGSATAHELATPLGTLLTWSGSGVRTVLAGSVTTATAEADAAALR